MNKTLLASLCQGLFALSVGMDELLVFDGTPVFAPLVRPVVIFLSLKQGVSLKQWGASSEPFNLQSLAAVPR